MAGEHFPPFARDWELGLRDRLVRSGQANLPFRVVRCEGRRAIVEVAHSAASAARAAWNLPDPDGRGPDLATRRTWGTLVGAKAWLRSARLRTDPDYATVTAKLA